MELGGKDADASSWQSLGEGKKKGRTAQAPVASSVPLLPSLTCPCCVLGARCPCSGSHMGSLCPWKSISMSFLQRDKPSSLPNQLSRAAGAAEAGPACFLGLVSGGTNDSLWVGPTKTHTKTSLREPGGPFGTIFVRALGRLPQEQEPIFPSLGGKAPLGHGQLGSEFYGNGTPGSWSRWLPRRAASRGDSAHPNQLLFSVYCTQQIFLSSTTSW